jgi:hypothetical protein
MWQLSNASTPLTFVRTNKITSGASTTANASYHRGTIGHALDLSGGNHPLDTYTVFVHEAEPIRRSAAELLQ